MRAQYLLDDSFRSGTLSRMDLGAWLSRQDASKQFGVHYNTIRNWERAGLVRVTEGEHGEKMVNRQDMQNQLSRRPQRIEPPSVERLAFVVTDLAGRVAELEQRLTRAGAALSG